MTSATLSPDLLQVSHLYSILRELAFKSDPGVTRIFVDLYRRWAHTVLPGGKGDLLTQEKSNSASRASKLDPAKFARTHRSAIVSVDRVRSLERMAAGECVITLSTGTKVPLSRGYRDGFRHKLEGRG